MNFCYEGNREILTDPDDEGSGAPSCAGECDLCESNSKIDGRHIQTAEARAKKSKAHMGIPLSPDHRARISIGQLGRVPSEETKRKISEAKRGKTHAHTPETREKISIARRGVPSPHPRRAQTPETRLKISIAKKGIKLGPFSKEHRAKLAIAAAKRTGEKCPMWRGGISFEPYCPKWNNDLRNRIRAFFGHVCVICGKTQNENSAKGGRIRRLHCHHVEYNKQACCDGKPVHFAALCDSCHSKTNHDRVRWESMIHIIIDEVYGGRSYFTKEEYETMRATGEHK